MKNLDGVITPGLSHCFGFQKTPLLHRFSVNLATKSMNSSGLGISVMRGPDDLEDDVRIGFVVRSVLAGDACSRSKDVHTENRKCRIKFSPFVVGNGPWTFVVVYVWREALTCRSIWT